MDPIERIERMDPIKRIERIERMDPIERIERIERIGGSPGYVGGEPSDRARALRLGLRSATSCRSGQLHRPARAGMTRKRPPRPSKA